MRQAHFLRPLPGLVPVVALALLAGCGNGDDGTDTATGGPLLGGSPSAGVLSLACPGSVTAGVKIVNGFSASLIQTSGAPVVDTFIGISPTPNMGEVFAPPEASTATFGGNTDAQGRLAFGFTAPAGAAPNSAFQLVAKSGVQTTSCRVTVQAASLIFTSPANNSLGNVCTPVRLRASSTASGDSTVKVASTVDLTASDGGLLTTSPTACTGSASLTGIGISGTTGDFQNPLYVVAPSIATTTVTMTDATTPSRSASVTVQFTDRAAALNLDADLLQVNASPSTSRFSNLTATVTNATGRPVANQPVRFTIESAVGGTNADRINPPVRTTGTAGTATSRYEAGSNTGNATVSACVQDTDICDRRTITVRPAS